MALIFIASAQSDAGIPLDVSDKSLHAAAYFGLAVLLVRALSGGWRARLTVRVALGAMLIAMAYGMSDEVHQLFVPGRMADVYDLYADATGAALGVAACWAWGIISVRSHV